MHLGFGFSAGLFDYVLNFSLATRPLLLLPIGLAYFALYYGLFRYFIVRFDLKTPGRETDEAAAPPAEAGRIGARLRAGSRHWGLPPTWLRWKPAPRGCGWWSRIPRASTSAPLKALGSRGVLKLADGAVQVVVGPIADQLASEIREALRRGASAPPETSAVGWRRIRGAARPGRDGACAAGAGRPRQYRGAAASRQPSVHCCARSGGRGRVGAGASAVRAIARPRPGSIHLVIGPAAATWFAEMKPS